MKHTNCKKHCIQLRWGQSTSTIRAENTPLGGHIADVDLWYCEDHETHFYHDWHQPETRDINLKLWREMYG